jgi:hypothetical protein
MFLLFLQIRRLSEFIKFGTFSLILFIIISTFLNINYYKQRLLLSEANISALVYLQGWTQAFIALSYNSGLGVGFELLGSEMSGFYALKLSSLGFVLNRADGSFLASKLIGEFGMFGIAFVIFSTIICSKRLFRYFQLTHDNTLPFHIRESFAICSSVAFLFQLFLRGTGYFTLPIFLFLNYGLFRSK